MTAEATFDTADVTAFAVLDTEEDTLFAVDTTLDTVLTALDTDLDDWEVDGAAIETTSTSLLEDVVLRPVVFVLVFLLEEEPPEEPPPDDPPPEEPLDVAPLKSVLCLSLSFTSQCSHTPCGFIWTSPIEASTIIKLHGNSFALPV